MTDTLTVYAVRDPHGTWLGTGRHGGWFDSVADAKLYQDIGQARGRVTYFANLDPGAPRCVIVEFSMSLADARVLDESDRVAMAVDKKAREEAQRAEDARLRDVGYARAQLSAARKRIKELEGRA